MSIMNIVANLSACSTLSEAVVASEGNKDLYLAWGKEAGYTVKELNDAWKAAQPKKAASASGFAAEYYDWLAEDSRSEQEAHDYIMAEGNSKNVKAHLTHYLNIWALAESVRSGKKVHRTVVGKSSKSAGTSSAKAKKEEAPKWEYDSSHPYADVRSAWETLKRVQLSKRPAKTKVHPDKVAHLGDEKLTEAYTKAFQIYNK